MIISKEGRKPYLDVPRLAEGVPERPVPEEYKSIQQFINSNNGFINPDALEVYLEKLVRLGFQQVDPYDIYTVPLGQRIAFITKENKWRSGGFLVEIRNSNSVYGERISSDNWKREYKPYILFKAFNNAIFSCQIEDVFKFWVKYPKVQIPNTPKFKIPTYETDFPVYLLNNNGDNVIVYYARDKHARERFLNSNKFNTAQIHGWMFEDGTQGENFIEVDADDEEYLKGNIGAGMNGLQIKLEGMSNESLEEFEERPARYSDNSSDSIVPANLGDDSDKIITIDLGNEKKEWKKVPKFTFRKYE